MTDASRNHTRAATRHVRHARRPLLLALVYGVFLVLIGGMVVALAVLVSAHFSAASISTTVSHDRALVRLWADGNLTSADLDPGRARPSRVTELQRQLAALVEGGEILHMEVRLPDGTVLVSDKNGLGGRRADASTAFSSALAGDPAAGLLDADVDAEALGFAPTGPLLREYLPIISADGEVAAVVGLWRDARHRPIGQQTSTPGGRWADRSPISPVSPTMHNSLHRDSRSGYPTAGSRHVRRGEP